MQINPKDIVWDETPKITPSEALIDEKYIVWDEEPISWDEREISHAKLKDITKDTLDDRTFLEQVKDGAKDTIKTIGSGIQDGLNIIAPLGQVDFMGDAYIGDEIRKDAAELIGLDNNEEDLTLQGYNSINKLSKTHINWDEPTQKDIDTYESNLANVAINHLGYEDLQKDEDGKYYVVKGDQEIELNKDTLKEIISDVYGDKMEIVGAMIGAKKGADIVPDALGKKANIAGSLVGSGVGAFSGNLVDQLDNIIEVGEKLNLSQRLDEGNKALALDMGANAVVGTVMDGVPYAYNAVKEANPFTPEKHFTKHIDTKFNTDEIKDTNLVETVHGLGGVDDQRLIEVADQIDTQSSLADNFEPSIENINTYLDDSETLITNTFNKAGINKIADDTIGTVDDKVVGNLSANVQGLEKYYHDEVYTKGRADIINIVGNEVIQTPSKTLQETNKFINSLNHPQNVKGQSLSNGQPLTEFEKDYDELVNIVNRGFKQDEDVLDEAGKVIDITTVDSDGYNLTGLMDMQKKFNEVFYKYKSDFSTSQHTKLKAIKDALYDDMKNYVYKKFEDETVAKDVIGKWENINGTYSGWLSDKGSFKEIDNLMKSDVDLKTISKDMIGSSGKVNKEHINFLSAIGKHLKITDDTKLDNFYDGIVNNLFDKSYVKAPMNGHEKVFDFEVFINNYDAMKGQNLNKLFSETKKGNQILTTLEDFRKVADYENHLQEGILKKGNSLSEAVKVAKDKKQGLLFGVEYFIRRTLLGHLADKLWRSQGFHTFVHKLAKKNRYELKDFDEALKYTQNKSKVKSYNISKDEIDYLKSFRQEVKELKDQREVEFKAVEDAMKKEQDRKLQEDMIKKYEEDTIKFVDAKIEQQTKNILPNHTIDPGAEKVKLDWANSQRDIKQSNLNSLKQKDMIGATQEQLDNASGTPQQVELNHLKKDSNYKEVIEYGKKRGHEDTKYSKTLQQPRQIIANENLGKTGDDYTIVPAAYEKNWDSEYQVTKQVVKDIENGKITDDIIGKIQNDLEVIKHYEKKDTESLVIDGKNIIWDNDIPLFSVIGAGLYLSIGSGILYNTNDGKAVVPNIGDVELN